jgi:hypothetical protein
MPDSEAKYHWQYLPYLSLYPWMGLSQPNHDTRPHKKKQEFAVVKSSRVAASKRLEVRQKDGAERDNSHFDKEMEKFPPAPGGTVMLNRVSGKDSGAGALQSVQIGRPVGLAGPSQSTVISLSSGSRSVIHFAAIWPKILQVRALFSGYS